MAGDSQKSDPEDPLAGFSVLSLLSRTFKPFSLYPTPTHKNDQICSIDAHLKAVELKSPHRLLEQSRIVLARGSEILNHERENVTSMENEVNKEAVVGLNQENPQGRRPALGRKRARFSLKPHTRCQAVEIPEPSINIKQLQDPEKYFSAFEKIENAKREIQRQRGVSLKELDQNVPSMNERPRRPGLSRKSISYKHRYSVEPSSDDQTFFSSQEAFSGENFNEADSCVQTEKMDLSSLPLERALSGLTVAVEDKATDNSDQLKSDKDEDIDGDEVIKMLQEHFKPIELAKSSLPDLQDIRRSEFRTYAETSQKSRDSISHLCDLRNALNGEGSFVHYNVVERSVQSIASPTGPTPVKSPFASMSLLKRSIFQSIPEKDPSSALDIDLSSVRNSPMNEQFNKQPNEVDIEELEVSTSLREKGSNPVGTQDAKDMDAASSAMLEKNVRENTEMLSIALDTRAPMESDYDMAKDDVIDRIMEDSPDEPSNNVGMTSNEHMELVDQRAVESVEPDVGDEPSRVESKQSPEADVEDPEANGPVSSLDQSVKRTREAPKKKSKRRRKAETEPSHSHDGADATTIGTKKAKITPQARSRRRLSCRESLVVFGTKLESGLRRSTRIRTRPLEYWKGERPLYGRVHQSLVTVIGTKYFSPAKGNGKPSLKVKSYVSDKYKDLVDLAALH